MQPFVRRSSAGVAFAIGLLIAAPAFAAGMAVIETVAPLSEQSEDAVKAAVMTAVETATRGAQAMGLPEVALKGVRVLPEMVIIQILATTSGAAGRDPDDQKVPPQPGEGPKVPPQPGEGPNVKHRL